MKRKTDFSAKPYYKCLNCHHRIAKLCDGPRTAPMELATWCEYMRDMKEVNGLTNAYIAEKSGVSVKTIERIMAINCDQDIMRETARKIENAIIGSSNQYPCYLVFEETIPNNAQQLALALADLERAVADNKDIRSILDNIHSSYAAEMVIIREEAQKKIDYMHEQVARLREEIDYLRLENKQKARVIEKFLDS